MKGGGSVITRSLIRSSGSSHHAYERLKSVEDKSLRNLDYDSIESESEDAAFHSFGGSTKFHASLLPEMWLEAFRWLPMSTLGRVSRVCKAFDRMSSSDQVWKPFLHRGGYVIDPLCLSTKLGIKDRFNFRIDTEIFQFSDPKKAEILCRLMREIFTIGISKLSIGSGECYVGLRAKSTFAIDMDGSSFKFCVPKFVAFKIDQLGLQFIDSAAPRIGLNPLPSSRRLWSHSYMVWDAIDLDLEEQIVKVQAINILKDPVMKIRARMPEKKIPCDCFFNLVKLR